MVSKVSESHDACRFSSVALMSRGDVSFQLGPCGHRVNSGAWRFHPQIALNSREQSIQPGALVMAPSGAVAEACVHVGGRQGWFNHHSADFLLWLRATCFILWRFGYLACEWDSEAFPEGAATSAL